MAASQAVLAPLMLEPPVRTFQHHEAAIEAMSDYQSQLCENAVRRRAGGLTVTDQDQPEEVFGLFPAHPVYAPLAIVGGMGPLAGAMAFRQACRRFRNSRVIVLHQACSMPDRSAVILSNGSGMALGSRLAGAIRLALKHTGASPHVPCCIMACNSAHYFWPAVVSGVQDSRVRMISLVESAVKALRAQAGRRALLLETEGARAGAVFSTPCQAAGIPFDQPPLALSRLLMRAIFEGIKSLDERRAVELGNEFFETTLGSGVEYDCVLAGCTEIPITIDLLRQRGSPAVIAFLSRVNIVDPIEEALRHA